MDYLLYILILSIIGTISSYFYELCISIIANKVVRDIRFDTYKKINYIPLNYIDSRSNGDVISRATSDIEIVFSGLLEGFKQLYKGIITNAKI